ncbi:outer membrane protein OmpU [Hasllibacter halocynthiae]|uniref:Outer membrane protein OmpU n=1 Tax=Hasllibacter halocynthiae TaxID=595589 RepID=A0A2T0X1G6_9RHOB|nr:porin [Hasllibacter halocynthiae]PRY92781.1 outer membrane protein OmpU [Hasllibacter halocynthiae]
MNRILLASTALVLSAGYAAAEVTVGGDARAGVVYSEGGGAVAAGGTPAQQAQVEQAITDLEAAVNAAQATINNPASTADQIETAALDLAEANAALVALRDELGDIIGSPGEGEFSFNSRIRISFSASGETDNGLQFGGSVRADNSEGGADGTAGSVFVSGAFGKLSFGDVDSGGKAAVGQVSGVGYTGLGDLNEITYISTPVDEAVLYEYAFGGATFYASIDQIGDDNDALSAGVSFGFGPATLALGYETDDVTGDHIIVGASAGFGDVTVKGVYGRLDSVADGDDDSDQYAVSLDFATGPTVLTAFVADQFGDDDDLNYGLGASYDLGGGASLKGGVAHNGQSGDDDDLVADFGVTMSF